MIISESRKLEWFGGDPLALDMYRALEFIAHAWDDIIDKDKPVSDEVVNRAFTNALVFLPSNPFYQKIQKDILPMWLSVIAAYETANRFEKEKDAHGIEIAHSLRYAVGHIITYAIQMCVGMDEAKNFIPEMWKVIVAERFDDYRKEHLAN